MKSSKAQLRALLVGLAAVATSGCWASSAVTASQFAVSESGAATVTVPIQVPRGIGGMEPQLSLNYSSGSGNGLLGLGWTLSGPSAVTRCPKTRAIDGVRGTVSFKTSDRFCLDGQRLMIETYRVLPSTGIGEDAAYHNYGNTYRTERDTFSRITSVGSNAALPDGFKVETKAGLILEFGLSANSRVLTNFVSGAGTATTNRWLLQRISDRNGNFVEFVYCGGDVSADGTTCGSDDVAVSGSKVLRYVRYTNRGSVNGTFAVVLGYESRPDRSQGFYLGTSFRQTQRLARIETYRDFTGPSATARGKLVRGYDVSYEPYEGEGTARATNTSRIQRIQERDKDGNTLPALVFTVTPDVALGKTVQHRATATAGTPRPPESCGGFVAGRSYMCP